MKNLGIRLSIAILSVAAVFEAPGQAVSDPARDSRDTAKISSSRHAGHFGLVQSWSTRFVVFPIHGPYGLKLATQNDARAVMSWMMRANDSAKSAHLHSRTHRPHDGKRLHRDWAISIDTSGNANPAYPAKYGFDVDAAPSCSADFVVFSAYGSVAGSPNILALNNLYSGTAGANGICNRTPTSSDTGVDATVMWSYRVGSTTEINTSSPELSLDGTRIVFVSVDSSGAEHFHVLAWKSGDGVNSANLQSVYSPVSITTFSSLAPAPGSGTATDLVVGGSGSLSGETTYSPFIDYTNDTAYISLAGTAAIVRVQNVFCTVNPACLTASPPAPSLDPSWGTAGVVTIGGTCTGSTLQTQLTAPVHSGVTGDVFAGCGDGKIYGFTSAGLPMLDSPLALGDGTVDGGFADPPLLDETNQNLFVVTSNGGTSLLAMLPVASSLSTYASISLGSSPPLPLGQRAPALNDAYFTNPDTSTWGLFTIAFDSGGTPFLVVEEFQSNGFIYGSPVTLTDMPSGYQNPSPMTEFMNSGVDRIFVAADVVGSGGLSSCNITDFTTTGCSGSNLMTITGDAYSAAGIVVDNDSAEAQASSVYFSTTTAVPTMATKLTQAGLQ